jgi:hypothetical protein
MRGAVPPLPSTSSWRGILSIGTNLLLWLNLRLLLSRVNVKVMSLDSSVGIATAYGMDDRMIRVRFAVGAGNFSRHHRVQTGSGAHPASYPMGTGGSFPGIKAVGA